MLHQISLPSWEDDVGLVKVGVLRLLPGDKVWPNYPLMIVSFVDEKAVLEIECPVYGIVEEIFVASGDEVVPNQLVMTIESNQ